MHSDQVVREQLLALLRGGNAHMSFEKAIAHFPAEHFNTKPANVTYTPWHILEHIRIAQWDILEFIRNPDHVSPQWPSRYWPGQVEAADQGQWDRTTSLFLSNLQALRDMVVDPDIDLYVPIPHAKDYTIFREILVVADHNAYHLGEFAILRQFMDTWSKT
jgi:hypothetical protein